MATGFHEVQFPDDISYGSAGGLEFKTEVLRLSSAHEQRNIKWTYPLERWDVAYGVKTETQIDSLRNFFAARQGRAYGFRFKNPDDYSVTDQELGAGDGDETEFQLVKTYSSGGSTLTRNITKPVDGTVVVYVDDVEETSGVSVDSETGIVTFGVAPSTGTTITADFQFDVPMRFDTDYLPISCDTLGIRSIAGPVPLLEIRV